MDIKRCSIELFEILRDSSHHKRLLVQFLFLSVYDILMSFIYRAVCNATHSIAVVCRYCCRLSVCHTRVL